MDRLVAALEEIGIRVLLNKPVRSVEKNGKGFVFRVGEGGQKSFPSDLRVHGAGREPDLETLDLRRRNIKLRDKGIAVSAFMQSISNPIVYAGGDAVASPLPLTPTATLEASVAEENIIQGNQCEMEYGGIPSTVFTTPPLAAVGKRERSVEEEGIDSEKRFRDTSSSLTSRMVGYRHSGYKLLIKKNRSHRILGAHILGHHAEEMINIFALAIVLGLSIQDLRKATWVYPSAVYDIKRMAEA